MFSTTTQKTPIIRSQIYEKYYLLCKPKITTNIEIETNSSTFVWIPPNVLYKNNTKNTNN